MAVLGVLGVHAVLGVVVLGVLGVHAVLGLVVLGVLVLGVLGVLVLGLVVHLYPSLSFGRGGTKPSSQTPF